MNSIYRSIDEQRVFERWENEGGKTGDIRVRYYSSREGRHLEQVGVGKALEPKSIRIPVGDYLHGSLDPGSQGTTARQ